MNATESALWGAAAKPPRCPIAGRFLQNMVTRSRPDSRMKIPANFLYLRITLYTPPPSTVFSTFEGGLISMCGSRRSYYPHSNRISDTNHNLTPVCIRGKYYKDLLPTIFQILKIFSSLLICKCLSNFHMFCSNIKG